MTKSPATEFLTTAEGKELAYKLTDEINKIITDTFKSINPQSTSLVYYFALVATVATMFLHFSQTNNEYSFELALTRFKDEVLDFIESYKNIKEHK